MDFLDFLKNVWVYRIFVIFFACVAAAIPFYYIKKEFKFKNRKTLILFQFLLPLALGCLTGAKFIFSFSGLTNVYDYAQIAFFAWIIGNLVGLSVIDLKYKAVYDDLLIPTTMLAALYCFATAAREPMFSFDDITSYYPILAPIIFGLLFLLVAFLTSEIKNKESLGSADVFIAVIMGSLLSFLWSFIALFISCVFAIIYQTLKGKKGESLPFIPFLTSGTIVSLICMSL